MIYYRALYDTRYTIKDELLTERELVNQFPFDFIRQMVDGKSNTISFRRVPQYAPELAETVAFKRVSISSHNTIMVFGARRETRRAHA